MEPAQRDLAERTHSLLTRAELTSAAFQRALLSVPPTDRDAWLDVVLGLDDRAHDDGPELPRGCVPYLPCPVDALLRMIDLAGVSASDVFVDVGSGVGRAALFVHLWTGASTIGLEIQPELVALSRDLAARLNVSRGSWVEGDAAHVSAGIPGSIFLLYCPFSGDRLEQFLRALEPIANARQIHVCAVDLPLPPRPWLELVAPPAGDLAVYRSAPVERDLP